MFYGWYNSQNTGHSWVRTAAICVNDDEPPSNSAVNSTNKSTRVCVTPEEHEYIWLNWMAIRLANNFFFLSTKFEFIINCIVRCQPIRLWLLMFFVFFFIHYLNIFVLVAHSISTIYLSNTFTLFCECNVYAIAVLLMLIHQYFYKI